MVILSLVVTLIVVYIEVVKKLRNRWRKWGRILLSKSSFNYRLIIKISNAISFETVILRPCRVASIFEGVWAIFRRSSATPRVVITVKRAFIVRAWTFWTGVEWVVSSLLLIVLQIFDRLRLLFYIIIRDRCLFFLCLIHLLCFLLFADLTKIS